MNDRSGKETENCCCKKSRGQSREGESRTGLTEWPSLCGWFTAMVVPLRCFAAGWEEANDAHV